MFSLALRRGITRSGLSRVGKSSSTVSAVGGTIPASFPTLCRFSSLPRQNENRPDIDFDTLPAPVFEKSLKEMVQTDMEKGYALLDQACATGHANSLFVNGLWYCRGDRGRIDMLRGVALLEKAAAADHEEALVALGILYTEGTLVDEDITIAADMEASGNANGDAPQQGQTGQDVVDAVVQESAQRRTEAANLSDPDMSELYSSHGHISPDYGRGLEYMKRASELGHSGASLRCYNLLASTIDGADDAVTYLEKAVAANEPTAHLQLGAHYLMIGDVENAIAALDNGAGLGFDECSMYLGHLYHRGDQIGQAADVEKALFFLENASKRNHHPSLLYLGQMYLNGDGVQQDTERGVSLLRDAAEHGNSNAHGILGDSYAQGQYGHDIDLPLAIHHYTLAADLENEHALVSLGSMAFYGHGREQSYEDAYAFYFRAMGHGNVTAIRNIADMFAKGLYVPQDDRQAKYYNELADRLSREQEEDAVPPTQDSADDIL